jgi:hypothetical protein
MTLSFFPCCTIVTLQSRDNTLFDSSNAIEKGRSSRGSLVSVWSVSLRGNGIINRNRDYGNECSGEYK